MKNLEKVDASQMTESILEFYSRFGYSKTTHSDKIANKTFKQNGD